MQSVFKYKSDHWREWNRKNIFAESHEIDISINFLTGEILAGKIPPKYKKEIMDKIFNDDNQKKLIESWNCTTDGIKIDLNYSFGIVTADF